MPRILPEPPWPKDAKSAILEIPVVVVFSFLRCCVMIMSKLGFLGLR